MRKEFKIRCADSTVTLDRLIYLFHGHRNEKELAKALDVTVATVQRYKAGTTSVPALFVRHLELLDSNHTLRCDGPWNGVRAEGTRLHIDPGYQLSIDWAEIARIGEYRRLYHLHELQTDLIERLLIENQFYRRELHKQSRFGMVINQLFP